MTNPKPKIASVYEDRTQFFRLDNSDKTGYSYGCYHFCVEMQILDIRDLYEATPEESLRISFTSEMHRPVHTTLLKVKDGSLLHYSGARCTYDQFVLLFAHNSNFSITYA